MSFHLLIADRAYSSWSMRGWLVFDAFDIPLRVTKTRMYCQDFEQALKPFAPARTVPALRCDDGALLLDSLAIAEEIAARYPQKHLWPRDSGLRAKARSLVSIFHSGFGALRNLCPMDLRNAYLNPPVSEPLEQELLHLWQLWEWAMQDHDGPWLCGAYSLADVFFAPVAARIAGHNIDAPNQARRYVARQLAHPSFRRWRAMALVDGADQPAYFREGKKQSWPGPKPRQARAVSSGPAFNEKCPYSGETALTYFMQIDKSVLGFCNAFCRDKSVADPEAWPQLVPHLPELEAMA